MYKIGDRVFYPMHGAGYIENIEIKTVGGQAREYYAVKIICGNILLMLPVEGGKIQLRDIISKEEAQKILLYFEDCSIDTEGSWGRRYKENMEKLKLGIPKDTVDVVKALMIRDKNVGLSTGDRQVMVMAKNILCSELSFALEREIPDLQKELQNMVDAQVLEFEPNGR